MIACVTGTEPKVGDVIEELIEDAPEDSIADVIEDAVQKVLKVVRGDDEIEGDMQDPLLLDQVVARIGSFGFRYTFESGVRWFCVYM
ncbi:hypothetical protein TWF281_009758 [Arthrobotrys megalospora]